MQAWRPAYTGSQSKLSLATKRDFVVTVDRLIKGSILSMKVAGREITTACSYTGNISRSGSNVLGRIICNSTLQSLREVRKESNILITATSTFPGYKRIQKPINLITNLANEK